MSARRHRAALSIVVLLAATAPASAHDQTTSYSRWRIDGRSAEVSVRLTRLDLTRFAWGSSPDGAPPALVARYLGSHLSLLAGDTPCTIEQPPQPIPVSQEDVSYGWRIRCPDGGELAIRSDLLAEVAPSHLHMARLEVNGGGGLERVLTEGARVWRLGSIGASAVRDSGAAFGGYVALGIEHILGGIDHLAFVAALLLLGGTLAETAKIVTGFTLAHSITLGLAVLDDIQPDRAPIEALIGLSVALVAAENLWLAGGKRTIVHLSIAALLAASAIAAFVGYGCIPALTLLGVAVFAFCRFGRAGRANDAVSLRAALAFLFGLLHGFGFGGELREAGLPQPGLGAALLGFNLGIEVGQLAVVAALWFALRTLAARRFALHAAVVDAASAAVLALGVFWFVSRTFL
jgi:hypothetical protein